MQYLPQLTSSNIFPVLDNKKYHNNLRKFNYHLPNIWTGSGPKPDRLYWELLDSAGASFVFSF